MTKLSILFNNISILTSYNLDLSYSLRQLGVRVYVDIEHPILLLHYLYEHINSNIKLDVIPYLSKLKPLVPRIISKVDVIHLNAWNRGIAEIARQRSKPVIFVLHAAPFDREFYREISDYVDVFVAPSIFTFNQERDKIGGKKIVIIHHGVNRKLFNESIPREEARKILGLPRDSKVILWNDRISPEKDITTFIKASETLLKTRSNIFVYIKGRAVNKDYYSRIENSLRKLMKTGRAKIHIGWIPHSKLPLLYRAADVFVRASLYENFGLGVIESMACGTPVIAPNTATFPEIIPYTQMLFRPGDPNDLVNKILGAIDNPEFYQELVKISLETAQKKFDMTITANKYVRLYLELMGKI